MHRLHKSNFNKLFLNILNVFAIRVFHIYGYRIFMEMLDILSCQILCLYGYGYKDFLIYFHFIYLVNIQVLLLLVLVYLIMF